MILLDTSVLIDYPKVRLPDGDLAFSAKAGQALSLGAAFATQNPKDFELVADLVQIIVPDRR